MGVGPSSSEGPSVPEIRLHLLRYSRAAEWSGTGCLYAESWVWASTLACAVITVGLFILWVAMREVPLKTP